jgi:UPF0755 protein
MKSKAVAGALLLTALCVSVLQWQLSPPRSGVTGTVKCEIPIGFGARAIGGRLKECGVIRSGFVFELYARLLWKASHLQAGTYVFSPSQSLPEIADIISSGRALSTDITVTLPEGMNIWEVSATLQQAGLVQNPAAFVREYLSYEGKLFPETYRFALGASHAMLLSRMTDTFRQHSTGVSQSQLIIASMLEKEAKTKDDMALIAGIIQKRMQLKMPLQIDATVTYGACARIFKLQSSNKLCDVTQIGVANELKIDGPYNTYTRTGLPTGPIANPGDTALWAAAHPKASDYVYYLSTRDGSRIIYSKTLAEHLKNRQKYLGF